MHPPPSPARANFTLMIECTPESSGYYSVYSVVHTHKQVVFFLKIVDSLSKVKPCTRRVPKIGKKTLESCNVQNFDNQVKAVVGAHMK